MAQTKANAIPSRLRFAPLSGSWQRKKDSYKGLEMRCAPGTHEAALALLGAVGAPKFSVLDLAAGSGAFLARLAQAGFSELHALELDADNFGLDTIRPLRVDLNGDFAARISRRFRLITAIEIIEHLDSPRHFLRQVHELLSDDGMLLLSTPNIANWAGRLQFLLTGELRMFEADLYKRMRHVSPITDTQMRLMLGEAGFSVLASLTAGEFSGPIKRLVTAPIALLFRLACGRQAFGEATIYAARKAEPDRRSPGATLHYSAARRYPRSPSTEAR